MQRSLLASFACSLAFAPAAIADDFDAQRELARRLSGALKTELTQALQTSPEHAISVCNERAPAIAASIARDHGVQIGRTALRVRSPQNAADDWRRDVLEAFATRQAAGEALAAMEYTASVPVRGADGRAYREHRYMKAIGTEPLCTVCHGVAIAPALQAAIAAKYPADAATGFSVGDLRGAVYVVRRELDASQAAQ